MTTINSKHANYAIAKMSSFHAQLKNLYASSGLNLLENIGRRNILLSEPMEKFLSEALQNDGLDVSADGRPGEPDILVKDFNKEIECKLTSRNSNGSINFQTDYETLKQKGSLDYIYIIASREFDKFCALYFTGLTVDDFRPLSNGARGKVSMYKWKGMEKCTVLRGEVVNITTQRVKKMLDDSKKKFVEDSIIKQRMISNQKIPSSQMEKDFFNWKDNKLKEINLLTDMHLNNLTKKARFKFILK